MNKNKYLFAAGICLIVFITLFVGVLTNVIAAECRIIRVTGEAASAGSKTLYLEPATVWVSKGDCVVWFNHVRDVEIKISFKEGKTCLDATSAPAGFKITEENCYVTSYIPMAGTSSLRFVKEGTYEFMVESKNGAQVNGKIIVGKY